MPYEADAASDVGLCSSRRDEKQRPAPSTHPLAAIDIVGLGDDVFGVIAGQEHGHAGEVLRLPMRP